jgi:DNA-directed RNA polymerase subunit RPC12/RpoP
MSHAYNCALCGKEFKAEATPEDGAREWNKETGQNISVEKFLEITAVGCRECSEGVLNSIRKSKKAKFN